MRISTNIWVDFWAWEQIQPLPKVHINVLQPEFSTDNKKANIIELSLRFLGSFQYQ